MAAGVTITIAQVPDKDSYEMTIDTVSFPFNVKRGKGAAAILRAAARVAEKAEYDAWVRRVTERV